jgi:hypothetical protein
LKQYGIGEGRVMAEVEKKVVVIFKKAEPKDQKPEEAKAVEVKLECRKVPTEAQRVRRKKRADQWQAAHPGMRYLQFVIEIELWNRFMAKCCTIQKPNAVFTRMIREAVEGRRAILEDAGGRELIERPPQSV